MRIGFIDFIDWDYDTDSPYEKPLGGGQSGVCYLSAALAARGHEVTLFTHTSRPGMRRGVRCLSLNDLKEDEPESLNIEAVVVHNAPESLGTCRSAFGPDTRLYVWCQHAADQPAVTVLNDPTHRGWDGIACLTDYHRHQFIQAFDLDPKSVVRLGNGIGPSYETLFAEGESLAAAKTEPLLAYTSTPFRGLSVLLEVFPRIREAVPGARLRVFSSMKVYNMEGGEDPYHGLYRQCQNTAGVEYVGSVSQTALAEELKAVKVLSYPNTFAETQCIAVMEALAAGAQVVTSDLGALPETCAGLASLVPMEPKEAYEDHFVAEVIKALRAEPDEGLLRKARTHFLKSHTWAHRAEAWEAWLAG